MPDLSDLDHFDQGLPPMNPLPPSEVRRRGDRRRRRTTGLAVGAGVLAVAVAIGTPVIALGGDDGGGRDIQPAPAPAVTPTAPADGWLTTIPEDFPLTGGFPDPHADPNDGLAQEPFAVGCDYSGLSGFTDNLVVTYQGDWEDRAVRALVVYPDAATAAAQLDEMRAALDGCGPFPVNGATRAWEIVDADLGKEETFAFAEQVHHDDGLVSDLTLFLVSRTGNALYVDSAYVVPGGPEQLVASRALLEARSSLPLERLCVFAAAPCST